MADERGVIFVLARQTRAGELETSAIEGDVRRMLEDEFAAKLGIDIEQLRAGSGTESRCDKTITSATLSGTETATGLGDMKTDKEADEKTVNFVDDMDSDS